MSQATVEKGHLQQRKVTSEKMSKKAKNTQISREVGLEIASICGQHFLKLEHLHYGYWPKDLEVDITNLHIAQKQHTDHLLECIPENIKTILDVGCGTGKVASRLIDMGYKVDCVTPSTFLADRAKKLLGDKAEIFNCRYEELDTDKKYDLVMFSESFQYIHIKDAFDKSKSLLNHNGYILIGDFFKKDVPGKCRIAGGHGLDLFYKEIENYGFEIQKDQDITEYTAPTIDIENDMFVNVGKPVRELIEQVFEGRHPWIYKLVMWRLRKKLNKIDKKYLDGTRNGSEFMKYKSYRLMLLKAD